MTNYYMDEGRKADLERLREMSRGASRREQSRLERTAINIRSESKDVRSMREALIKANRSGNVAEIKDIHDFIKNKDKYR